MTDERKDALAVRELPEPIVRRGIEEAVWLTLCNSLYPGANPKSVLMVWDYCAARKLDPLKKPVHIVPMRVKGQSGQYEWRDVVMPGVYEHRITAQRTGEYLGHSKPEYGPIIEFGGVSAPEWCELTMYRWNKVAKQKVEFPVRVHFREVVALKDGHANDRWTRAPIQMLTKCTEAAGTREAFPEEVGGEPTAEEMDGQHATIDITASASEVVVSSGLVAFEQLAEPFRDNIEQAFAALKFSPAKRLTTLNEFLGGKDVDLEVAASSLLAWCQEKLKAPPKPPAKVDNGKKVAPPQVGEPVVESSRPDGELGF